MILFPHNEEGKYMENYQQAQRPIEERQGRIFSNSILDIKAQRTELKNNGIPMLRLQAKKEKQLILLSKRRRNIVKEIFMFYLPIIE